MTEFIELMRKTPVVLNDIIIAYIGNDETQYCYECEKIENIEDWVMEEDEDDIWCPHCYFKCDNGDCEEIHNMTDVNQVFNDGKNINLCDDCIESECFFCDLHKEHILYINQEERTCVDCDRTYCDTCFYDEDITFCESCSEYSCCRKFIRIRKYGRDEFCDKCVEHAR